MKASCSFVNALGQFVLRPGSTDAVVVDEVWQRNVYRMTPERLLGQTVVDVGLNIGAFSILAERMGAASVHAYECDPDNYATAVRNLAANRTKLVTPHQLAVTGSAEVARTFTPGLTGGSRLSPDGAVDVDRNTGLGVIEVTALTLDAIVGEHGPVGFLKMDVEGAEYEIFEAASDDTLKAVRFLSMEFHSTDPRTLDPAPFGAMIEHLAEYFVLEIAGRLSAGIGMLTGQSYYVP